MTTSTSSDIKLQSEQISNKIVLNCLKILAHYGSYEAGSVDAFNAIAKHYGIDVSYTEMADLEFDEI